MEPESEAKFFQTVLRCVADGVFTIDREWRITSFNRAAEKIIGISRERAIGQPCRDIFRANICEGACTLRQTIETGTPVIGTAVTILDAAGNRKPISISTAILRDRQGNIVGGVETFRDLTMIEQPLGWDDLWDHAKLQRELSTPICLDESIHSADDARKAIEMHAGRIINIKLGRVGGFTSARAVHDLCRENNIPVWCGGMLESGIGRAHNIALSSLPGFTLPGDVSASQRYWKQDIIDPEVTVSAQ